MTTAGQSTDNDDIHIKGGTDETLIGNVSDSLKTNVTASALPSGAATSALQTTGNSSLSSIDTKTPALVSGRVPVDGSGVTQPISVASLPLPTGAATSANQSSELTLIGAVTETAPATDTASSGLNGRLQRIAQRLTFLIAQIPATLGQKTMANSLAVAIASDQSAVPASQSGTWNINNISGTVSLPTGASTAALQTSGNASLSSIDTKTPTLGSALSSASTPVVLSEDQTYAASIAGLSIAANATDVFTLTGSGTKTIKILQITVDGTTTSGSGAAANIQIIKRSTANSAGTSTTPAVVPFDSNNAAGTAVARAYTANPTLGTTVGTILSERFTFPTTGANGNGFRVFQYNFGRDSSQPIILRGTSQVIAVNYSGTSVTGSNMAITIQWTEI